YSIKPTPTCQQLTVPFTVFFSLHPLNPAVIMFFNVQFFIENVIYWFIICHVDIVRENLIKKHFHTEVF
ncbi:hypothetical protein, partial [Lactococcus lactis]|uniref:hypothetical protein n=1 Tax=Lactococcus lactis TaxID=1358 RepID=UPI00223C0D85